MQTARSLSAAATAGLIVVGCNLALGQHVHTYNDPAGEIVLAVYQGDSDWLVTQSDPRSHLHKHARLSSVRLLQHDISAAELLYVCRLEHLRSLVIGEAPDAIHIDANALSSLRECTRLEELWICKKDLKDCDLQFLLELPELKALTIEGGDMCEAGAPHGLTGAAASILAKMKALETLHVRGDAGFSDSSVSEIARLPKLTSLELRSSKLTDKSLDIIASTMRLHRLRLESSSFSTEMISKFKDSSGIDEIEIDASP